MNALIAYSDSSSDECPDVSDFQKCCPNRSYKPSETSNSTETNVNSEKEQLSSTESAVKTVLDEHKHNRENDARDFFGINNSSSSEDESNSTKKSSLDTSVVPQTPFWFGLTKTDDWGNPETVWKNNESLIEHEKNQTQAIKRKACDVSDLTDSSHATVKKYISRNKDVDSSDNHLPKTPCSHPIKQKCYFVHHKVSPFLHSAPKNSIPKGISKDLTSHVGAVNRLQWCKAEYGHLLLSAGMDRTVRIWNIFASDDQNIQTFNTHTKAVKDCKWVNNGRQVLSASYDRTARIFDVEKGTQLQTFDHAQFVTCLVEHPVNPHLFLSGTLNRIVCWDMRCADTQRRVFAYKEPFGQVQDLAFTEDGSQFFSCSDLVSRDSSDRNIMAWDFSSGVVLSNQIYQERYTCTRLRVHPHEATLLSQSSGGYIALFSTIPPYKMDKYKRLQGHKVEDYNSVGFDVSPDGRLVVSSSCDGRLVFYDYHQGKCARSLSMEKAVCLDVAWNPVLPSTVAVSTWGGRIRVYH